MTNRLAEIRARLAAVGGAMAGDHALADLAWLVERVERLEALHTAARALRDRGYDGPMMGPDVEPLFAALRALDADTEET